MNEITRIPNNNTALSTSTRARAIDQVVLAATSTEIARKAQSLASEIHSIRRPYADDDDTQAFRIAEHRRVIAMAEPMLASPEYKALIATLSAAVELATLAQVKQAIGGLIACYPSQADVSIFVAFCVEEVAIEAPSLYTLAAACRQLRRTKTFRPSIAEILEAMQGKGDGWIRRIVHLDDDIHSMRMIANGASP